MRILYSPLFRVMLAGLLVASISAPVHAQGSECIDRLVVVLLDSSYSGPADLRSEQDDVDTRDLDLGDGCGLIIRDNDRDNRILGVRGEDVQQAFKPHETTSLQLQWQQEDAWKLLPT